MKVIGFSGYSGSGKTTLVEQLIARLKIAGQRVSVVKHAHHAFDIDQPGKDSWRHRQAGAFEVVIASDRRLALFVSDLLPKIRRDRGRPYPAKTGVRPPPRGLSCGLC